MVFSFRKTGVALAISGLLTAPVYALELTAPVVDSDSIKDKYDILSGVTIQGDTIINVLPGGITGMITNNGILIAENSAIKVVGNEEDSKVITSIGFIENKGHIESKNGAAIFAGKNSALTTKLVNRGKLIGGMVGDEQVAIDISQSNTGAYFIEAGRDSYIKGSIYLNATENSKTSGGIAEVQFKGNVEEEWKTTFDGARIAGVNQIKIFDDAWMILKAQDETINFDLVNYKDKSNEDTSLEGEFSIGAGARMEMELNGWNRNTSNVVLKVNNGDVKFNGSEIYLTAGEGQGLVDIYGQHVLIKVDEGNSITGDYSLAHGWLTEVTEVEGDDTNITVNIEYNETASSATLMRDAAAGGADTTEVAVVGAFGDIVLGSGDGKGTFSAAELANLMNLAGTGSPERAATLAGELTPDRSGAILHATQNAQNRQLDNVNRRLNAIHASETAGGYGGMEGMWFRAFGHDGSKDVEGRVDGYDLKGSGFSIGTDGLMSDNVRAGFAFGYSAQETDGQLYDTSHDIESYQLSAYSLFYRQDFFINASANVGMNSYESERTIGESLGYTGETKASSSYDGYSAAARLVAGKDFTITGTQLQPLIAAEFNHTQIDAYEEDGSPASLGYGEQSIEQFKLGAGANVFRHFSLGDYDLTARLSGMAWHDFNADNHEIDAFIIEDPSTKGTITTATGSSENRFDFEAAIDLKSVGGLNLGLDVIHTIEDDFNDTALQFRAEYAL